MFHQCQTAFPPSTKIPLFTFQSLFSLNFCLYLFASEVHPLTGVSPCHCNQVRVTGHGLSSLMVKFLIFIFFFQAWELFHDITHFLKQHIFLTAPATNLVTPTTCQYPSIFCFDYCQKFSFRIFNSFSQKFQLYTSWQLYLANPSRTAINQYCHTHL